MGLDERLLSRAREAGARLAEAEHQVVLSRGAYHAAVRRLHLAGAPLRDIADALSLSHQRVQQIVRSAGGSWWMRWRGRRRERDMACTWCSRPPAEVSKLIAGPGIFICEACVEAAERALAGGVPEAVSPASRVPSALARVDAPARARCTFCRKRADDRRAVVEGPANVCTDCLTICREILDGSRQG